jgi:hypothetical protein
MPGSTQGWDPDLPDDARENTVDLPRLRDLPPVPASGPRDGPGRRDNGSGEHAYGGPPPAEPGYRERGPWPPRGRGQSGPSLPRPVYPGPVIPGQVISSDEPDQPPYPRPDQAPHGQRPPAPPRQGPPGAPPLQGLPPLGPASAGGPPAGGPPAGPPAADPRRDARVEPPPGWGQGQSGRPPRSLADRLPPVAHLLAPPPRPAAGPDHDGPTRRPPGPDLRPEPGLDLPGGGRDHNGLGPLSAGRDHGGLGPPPAGRDDSGVGLWPTGRDHGGPGLPPAGHDRNGLAPPSADRDYRGPGLPDAARDPQLAGRGPGSGGHDFPPPPDRDRAGRDRHDHPLGGRDQASGRHDSPGSGRDLLGREPWAERDEPLGGRGPSSNGHDFPSAGTGRPRSDRARDLPPAGRDPLRGGRDLYPRDLPGSSPDRLGRDELEHDELGRNRLGRDRPGARELPSLARRLGTAGRDRDLDRGLPPVVRDLASLPPLPPQTRPGESLPPLPPHDPSGDSLVPLPGQEPLAESPLPSPEPAAESPATIPPQDAPDPALAELAERIRELQALAASPSPPIQSPPPAGATEAEITPAESASPDAQTTAPPTAAAEPAADLDEHSDTSRPGVELAPRPGGEISHLRAKYEIDRQDDTVSDSRVAASEPAPVSSYGPRDETPPDRLPAVRASAGELAGGPAYPPARDYRAMDYRTTDYRSTDYRTSDYRITDYRTGPADYAARPPDRPERPARGSVAELRLRLGRLPAGHPSSPYDDQGLPRSSPQQLRQLELPLAEEERDADPPARASLLAASADLSGPSPKPGHGDEDNELPPSPAPPALEAPPGRNGSAEPAARSSSPWLTSHNGADHDAGAISSAGPDADDDHAGNGTGPSRNGRLTPAAALRRNGTDPYDTGTSYGSPEPSAPNGRTASPSSVFDPDWRSPDPAPAPNGHAEPPAGRPLRGRVLGDRPAPAADDSPDGALGSQAPGDRAAASAPPVADAPANGSASAADTRSRLTAEQDRIADQALEKYRAADGRNMFGGYGESGLTPAMRRVEAYLPHGRLAPDSEENSLKSPERFKEKLARMIERNPGIPPAELADEIYDAARYTFVFEPQDYTDGTWLVHRRLKAQGFELEARRNLWENHEVKGIKTRWRDPAHDLAFEVQFHTPSSWEVLQRTHEAYLRITDPQTPPAERVQLRARQAAEAAAARAPVRCAEIGDFRAEAR